MSMQERQRVVELELRVARLEATVARLDQLAAPKSVTSGNSETQTANGITRETLKVPKRG